MRARALLHGGLVVLLVCLGYLGYAAVTSDAQTASSAPSLVTATRGVVLSSVTGTGNIAAGATADATFRSTVAAQPVTSISVAVGQQVSAGQELARVDDTQPRQQVASAQVQLDAAVASQTKLLQGLTPTELAQDQAALAQSQVGLANAQAVLSGTVASTQQDDATASSNVLQAQATLAADQTSLADAQAGGQPQATVDALTAKVTQDQAAVTSATNAAASTRLKSQQSVQSAQDQVAAAQAGTTSTAAGNAVKEEPASPDKVAAAAASVLSAENQLSTANQAEADTVLRAPIAGTVASVSGQVGGSGSGGSTTGSSGTGSSGTGSSGTSSSAGAVGGTSATSSGSGATSTAGSGSGSKSTTTSSGSTSSGVDVTIANLSTLQVRVGFSETDAVHVAVGQAARMTLDALPGQPFTGTVTSVDIDSTLVNNVVTYDATVSLDAGQDTTQVKPGMTTEVSIVTQKVDDAVMLPSAAISARGTRATLTVHGSGGKVDQRSVTIGLRGDQSVQILSGLQAGEKVEVAPPSSVSSSGAAARLASSAGGGIGGAGAIARGGGGGFTAGGR